MRLWSESTTISATMVLGCQPRAIQRMTDEGLPADRLNRILTAVETIEESLGVLARKQQIDREDYKNDSGARDIVERRFVKTTEAAIDIDGFENAGADEFEEQSDTSGSCCSSTRMTTGRGRRQRSPNNSGWIQTPSVRFSRD